jgi:putative peptide zinc metalloprotease protein
MHTPDAHMSGGALRPQRAQAVETHLDAQPYGAVGVLKDVKRWTYFTLSALGLSVWQRIDGARSIQEIVSGVVAEHPGTAPLRVCRVLAQLRDAGFARFEDDPPADTPSGRVQVRWTQPLVWEIWVHRSDAWFDWLYRHVGKIILSRLFVLTAAVLGAIGLMLFVKRGGTVMPDSIKPLPVVVFAAFAAGLLHESMHAMVVKHAGRTVGGTGIGWFWFGPALFVDTSDMWLGTRRQRIAVTIAGPAVNFVLAGAASTCAATLYHGGSAGTALWAFSAVSYYQILINLCPLLEYDGYFLLSDLLKCPNLRRNACSWLGTLLRTRNKTQMLRTADDRLFICYSVASLAYIVVLAVVTTGAARVGVEKMVVHFLPAGTAHLTALVTSIAFAMLVVYGVLKDFFGAVPRAARIRLHAAH